MKGIHLATAALCFCTGLLEGCSPSTPTRPEASDVAEVIAEAWGPCKLVKPTGVKKINGVDQGATYQIAISYKLEIARDISVDDFWGPEYAVSDSHINFWETNCPLNPAGAVLFGLVGNMQSHYRQPFKKGEEIAVSTEYTMVKSERGWIIQQ